MGIKQIITLESDTVSEKTIRIPFEFTDLDSVPGRQADGRIYHDHTAYRALVVPGETFVVGY